jgi:hypothetical protein
LIQLSMTKKLLAENTRHGSNARAYVEYVASGFFGVRSLAGRLSTGGSDELRFAV